MSPPPIENLYVCILHPKSATEKQSVVKPIHRLQDGHDHFNMRRWQAGKRAEPSNSTRLHAGAGESALPERLFRTKEIPSVTHARFI